MNHRLNTGCILQKCVWLFVAFLTSPAGMAAGIEMTNGRVAMTSALLFLSPAQEKEADARGSVTLTPGQRSYLGTASFLRHDAIANLKVLPVAGAQKVDPNLLLNIAVRLTNDMIDVPFDFLGRDLAERDQWRNITLHTETSSSSRDTAVLEYRKTLWFDFRHYITPRLCQYYALHPDRFRFVGKDEEVDIRDFAEFVAGDEFLALRVGGFEVHKGRIYDPWGEPLHFVRNRDGDGFVKARGFKHIVSRMEVDELAECLNEKEQLGVCKHSITGFEDAPHACIYVDVYYEAEWAKEKRLKESPAPKSAPTTNISNPPR